MHGYTYNLPLEGFTLTQGTKDAMNAIYSLEIEPIDPLPTPRMNTPHSARKSED